MTKQQNTAPTHAVLSASGSATWLYCSGSVEAQKQYAETRSLFADEGTCAHELAEICLNNNENPFDYEGKTLPESNWTVDKEMCRHVQDYIDFIKLHKGHHIYEHRVNYSDYAQDGFGTADCIIIDKETVTIIDLKYGKGVRVDADTTQTKIYALGVLSDFGMIYDIQKIKSIIFQPRLDHIDESEMDIDELHKFGEWVKERAKLALSENAPRTAGEKQCKWCKHKARCPELQKETERAIAAQFGEFDELTPVNRLTDEHIKTVLESATLIRSWLSAVEEMVRTQLEEGKEFSGFKLVEGRSSREWVNQEEAIYALSADDELKKDDLFETSFISVAKFEKLVGKKNVKKYENLFVKRAGKPTVVPSSDPRSSIAVNSTDFSCFDD